MQEGHDAQTRRSSIFNKIRSSLTGKGEVGGRKDETRETHISGRDNTPNLKKSQSIPGASREVAGADEDKSSKYNYPILKGNMHLKRIGDAMRALQGEVDSAIDRKNAAFVKNEVPKLKMEAKKLSLEIIQIRKEAQSVNDDPSQTELLATAIDQKQTRIDQIMRSVYYHTHKYAIGKEGIYAACNDLWLETLAGKLLVQLVSSERIWDGTVRPSKIRLSLTNDDHDTSQIGNSKRASTSTGTDAGGAKLKIAMQDFGLKCESTKLPTLSLAYVELELVCRITMLATFIPEGSPKLDSSHIDYATFEDGPMRWYCEEGDFSIDVIAFNGPFAIGLSLATTIIGLLAPKIRNWIFRHLPPEVGTICMGPPHINELIAHGSVLLSGTPIQTLSGKIIHNRDACNMLQCTPAQAYLFRFMQKSVDTPSRLKTMGDVVKYINRYSNDSVRWGTLCGLWTEAMVAYHKLVKSESQDRNDVTTALSIPMEVLEFGNLVGIATSLARKQLKFEIDFHEIRGQLSLRRLLHAFKDYKLRDEEAKARENVNKGLMSKPGFVKFQEEARLESTKEHIERGALLTLMCTYITAIGMTLRFQFSPDKVINMAIERAHTSLPVVLLASLPVNPFSKSISSATSFMYGTFLPTPSETITVTSLREGTATDIQILSSAGTQPIREMKSRRSTSATVSSRSRSRVSGDEDEKSLIFHTTLNRYSLGLVFSPEWGVTGEGLNTVGPGTQLFSVVISDTKPNEAVKTKSAITKAYELIVNCQDSRPLCSGFISSLPCLGEVEAGETNLNIADWPVKAYLDNRDLLLKLKLDERTILGIKKAVLTLAKYLLLKESNIDVAIKFNLDSSLFKTSPDSDEKDVMFCFSTPDVVEPSRPSSTSPGTSSSAGGISAALKFHVDLSLYDVIDDLTEAFAATNKKSQKCNLTEEVEFQGGYLTNFSKKEAKSSS